VQLFASPAVAGLVQARLAVAIEVTAVQDVAEEEALATAVRVEAAATPPAAAEAAVVRPMRVEAAC
jgi:hypothetical protein